MVMQLELGGVSIDVVRKDIKNLHLSVHPPSGRVRISAPARMDMDAIRVFAISKLGWIKRHRHTIEIQERETPREFLDRESHFVWGRRYLLTRERADRGQVELKHNRLVIRAPSGTGSRRLQSLLDNWYRSQLHEVVPPLLARWEPMLRVKTKRFFVQHMKTKWGSCNHRAGTIRLNTELARKPPVCLEYIMVHELVHLIEPTHGPAFVALMDRYMPKWRHYRDELNRLPVRHENWIY